MNTPNPTTAPTPGAADATTVSGLGEVGGAAVSGPGGPDAMAALAPGRADAVPACAPGAEDAATASGKVGATGAARPGMADMRTAPAPGGTDATVASGLGSADTATAAESVAPDTRTTPAPGAAQPEADRAALAVTALAAVGGRGDEVLFLAGSTTDGLANRNSDLDLYIVGDFRVTGTETAARQGERTATVAYHQGREVNVAVLDPAALGRLRDAFHASAASLSGEKGIAQLVDEDDLKILHRVRTGQALRRPDRLRALREELGTGDLPRYLLNVAAVAAVNRLTDVSGELADGHTDSAAWMYREALVHTGQCALAAAGVTVPSVKWLVRLLQREAARHGDAGCAAHVARRLLAPPADTAAAVAQTRAELAAVIDAAGDRAGTYVRTVARRKLG